MPTPAPAPGTNSPLFNELLAAIVLLKTPKGELDPVSAAAGCEASVIPQSNGLFITMLPVIMLSWVVPVSSVSRIPPVFSSIVLFATVEWSTPVRWRPSPQSKLSPVSKDGIPGQDGAVV